MNQTETPLDTSRTVCQPEQTSYFEDIIYEEPTSRVHSRVTKKTEGEEVEDELRSISSNSTIGNNVQDTRGDMLGMDNDLEFPEGGLKAYTVVFGSFMGLIAAFGLLNTYGIIETYVSEHQLSDVPSSSVAWVFSIFGFISFLTSIISGTYFDRNGARRPLIIGGICTFVGMMCLGNCTEIWQLVLSFSILVGIGSGFTGPPCLGVVAQYFHKRRGFMCSIASTGGSVGGIVFPIMMRKLFEEVSYAWAIRIFAFILGFCYIVAIILMEERLPRKTAECGTWQNILSYITAFDLKGLKQLDFLFVCLACTFAECGVLIMGTYQASFARAHGYSLSTAYLLLSVTHIGGIPGRWISGYMSDVVGRFNIIIVTTICSSIVAVTTLIPFGDRKSALFVFSVLWGFMTGSVFPLLPVCCAQISKTEDFGRRYGTMYFIVAFGVLIAIPISGAIIGDGSEIGYRNMVIHSALTIFGSGLIYFLAKCIRVRGKIFTKY
ncbi:MCT family MFS transporter [Cyberlindnera jadinii NRRL Y-1542]|uniref:MFS general substrate transporter n=1 Tax=Cyberlindnera jadinii (strain ATCC 18201 / CBS 1600 / BCRC 20928 / JCM 3617 / NBRC 0987 / NRRL Y-1542) TaxID=983966 RepID=A0A1E4RY84_CYBJN|nr:MFS general substrate transporter [Cyberlindnera jadinii NRRL Y-1542]ODV72224.1 MFS general substrate transporter [Cyberlindnera jadinii NRRL Y-1542]